MKKHTYEYIKNFFKQNNCELIDDVYINSKTKMKYKCICQNIAFISFNSFQKGTRCMGCSGTPVHTYEYVYNFIKDKNCILISKSYKNANEKLTVLCVCKKEYIVSFKSFQLNVRCRECNNIKMKKNNLEKYGVEYASQNKNIKNKIKEKKINKTDLEFIEIQNKRKQTNLKKYGVEHQMFCEDIKNKIKQTNLKKYGVEHPMFCENVKNKIKETNLEKYGVECVFQNKNIKNKIKETNFGKYGVEHPMFCEDIKSKIKQTNLEKHGVECVLQNKNIKDKIKKTNLEKYGYENPMQNYDIAEKSQKKSYNLKEYKLPSSKIIKIQGYENYALDILLKKLNENDIIIERKNIPIINYKMNDKIFTYYPDIFLPKENKIIEVKSIWTYNINLEKNILKKTATINNGYNFEFWIFDNKKQLNII